MWRYLFAAVSVLLMACSPYIKAPKGFAEERDPSWPYIYRAIGPDDVILGVQKRENNPKGNLAFWTKVFAEKFPRAKGYRLVKNEELKTGEGLKGALFEYEVDGKDGRTYRYLLFVIVRGKTLWLLEAGGPEDKMASERNDVIASFRSFKP